MRLDMNSGLYTYMHLHICDPTQVYMYTYIYKKRKKLNQCSPEAMYHLELVDVNWCLGRSARLVSVKHMISCVCQAHESVTRGNLR